MGTQGGDLGKKDNYEAISSNFEWTNNNIVNQVAKKEIIKRYVESKVKILFPK